LQGLLLRLAQARAILVCECRFDCCFVRRLRTFERAPVRLDKRPLCGFALGPHALLRLSHGGLDFALMLGVEGVHVGAVIREEFLLARL
jgi:hypothetical protein